MIRKYKKSLILSSLVTLLPILVGLLLWDRLPDTLVTHWGADGQPDGWSPLPVAVFLPPLLILAGQWICFAFTARDPGNQGRNEKPMKLVLWILPVISNFTCGTMYALALGLDFSPLAPMGAILGLMFLCIGNYMPKCRMNSTIGIKVYWTYTSQENWNATHRFAGKVWVAGGIAMLLAALLPEKAAIALLLTGMLVLALLPIGYSFVYYKRQKAQGAELSPLPRHFQTNRKFSLILPGLILCGVLVIMFTGHIDVHLETEALRIEASYYSDLTVEYAVIDRVEFREGNVEGTRVGGWGSARLLLGYFRNAEFGNHTRYTVTDPDCCIVIYTPQDILVLSGDTAEETRFIYEGLMNKLNTP